MRVNLNGYSPQTDEFQTYSTATLLLLEETTVGEDGDRRGYKAKAKRETEEKLNLPKQRTKKLERGRKGVRPRVS